MEKLTKLVYRVDEAALLLRVSTRTVYRLIEEGALQAFRVRCRDQSPLRIPAKSIEEYIEFGTKLFSE